MIALAQGAGGRVPANGCGVSLGDDEHVLKLMCGFGCTMLTVPHTVNTAHFKMDELCGM